MVKTFEIEGKKVEVMDYRYEDGLREMTWFGTVDGRPVSLTTERFFGTDYEAATALLDTYKKAQIS